MLMGKPHCCPLCHWMLIALDSLVPPIWRCRSCLFPVFLVNIPLCLQESDRKWKRRFPFTWVQKGGVSSLCDYCVTLPSPWGVPTRWKIFLFLWLFSVVFMTCISQVLSLHTYSLQLFCLLLHCFLLSFKCHFQGISFKLYLENICTKKTHF